jgi:ATP-dependent RNA helicase SUPV3L1/SUV3
MSRITAILGPTNTGKTYLALERMMGHASGMIGFPLRLLARENYDRVAAVKGTASVALVTGEERILPPKARYYICTVESMPLDLQVEFLAIDEVQLAADPERGHIFTDRLLKARGLSETMFLGSASMKGLIQQLAPRTQFESRPRFSKLEYSGPRKLLRLPPRSAVVAFSASEVYGMADLIRRQKGGAAVVLGALSPRTRNAQVGLYQAGEVDYLVATDAIGMGLNMNVDHVAFAGLRKFDGRGPRALAPGELAQIAGRAGRHMNDGTFGTTADCPDLASETVAAIEGHVFPPIKSIMWRNSDLRFVSVAALLADLERAPKLPGLMRARDAEDHLALQALSRESELMEKAQAPERVRLLWEVAQIPDFRKLSIDEHAKLLRQIFLHLTSHHGHLDEDWLDQQVKRLDRVDGEIDHLSGRIAGIRTWTYVSHRADWVKDPKGWQERTRAIEDKLSDALHERLTQRFIDRRTSVLARKMKEGGPLPALLGADGAVEVEGHAVGKLDGFSFTQETGDNTRSARTIAQAAEKILAHELKNRADALMEEAGAGLSLNQSRQILWQGAAVALLSRGGTILRPALDLIGGDALDRDMRQRLVSHLKDWCADYLRKELSSLYGLEETKLRGAARGLAYQLCEGLGLIDAKVGDHLVKTLTLADRKALERLGVRFGRLSIFLPALLKPRTRRLTALLWSVWKGRPSVQAQDAAISQAFEPQDAEAWRSLGFLVFNGWCLRADKAEDLALRLEALAALGKAFALPPDLCPMTGLKTEALNAVVAALGYRLQADGMYLAPKPQRARNAPQGAASPFAVLKERIG